MLFKAIQQTGEKFGQSVVVNVLIGSNAKLTQGRNLNRLPIFGAGRHHHINWWKCLFDTLRSLSNPQYIQERRAPPYGYSVFSLTPKARDVIQGRDCVTIVPPPFMLEEGGNPLSSASDREKLRLSAPIGRFGNDGDSIKLYHYLLQVREEEAKKKGVAPYMVFESASIEQMASVRPTDADTFRSTFVFSDFCFAS